MLRKFPRLLIVLVMTLVVPLQGAAAIGAAQCMALDHHDMAAGHDHDAGLAHGHGDGQAHDQGRQGTSGGDAHCGPCVACCASATIASPVPVFAPLAPAGAVDAIAYLFQPGDLPDELDRPPLAL